VPVAERLGSAEAEAAAAAGGKEGGELKLTESIRGGGQVEAVSSALH